MSEYFPHDVRNYSIANQFCAFFSEETSPGSGTFEDYKTLGNIVDSSFTPQLEELEHFTNYSGINRKDTEVITSAGGQFNLTLDEIVCDNMRWIFGSSARTTGATVIIPKDDVVAFSGTAPSTIAIVNSGAAIHSSISLYDRDCTRYVEGVDFSVVLGTGTYTRIGAGAIPVSGTVHALYNVSQSASSYPIMDRLNIEGKLKVINLAPEVGPAFVIELNRCRVRLDGDISFAKDDWRTAVLQAEMLEDANGDFGTIYQF